MTYTHTGFAVRQPRRGGGRRGYNYSQCAGNSYGRPPGHLRSPDQ